MRFQLVDAILEQEPLRIVAVKNVSAAEEYLGEHFPGFSVLPGVFMIEAMVQAARVLLGAEGRRHVLGSVRALRYGSFVRPGEALRVEVALDKRLADGIVQFKGTGSVLRPAELRAEPDPSPAETAVTGRFTMRPIRPLQRVGHGVDPSPA
jgi:3-hydroxyacyl-[acyl-carrier-protein] dehydratase